MKGGHGPPVVRVRGRSEGELTSSDMPASFACNISLVSTGSSSTKSLLRWAAETFPSSAFARLLCQAIMSDDANQRKSRVPASAAAQDDQPEHASESRAAEPVEMPSWCPPSPLAPRSR
jgi:hypothetical protein